MAAPQSISEPSTSHCDAVTGDPLRFCRLLSEVSGTVAGIVIDKTLEISVHKAAVFLFSKLTPQAQRALLSGKFMKLKIIQGAYTKTINKTIMPSVPTRVLDFFDDPFMDFLAYFFKSLVDDELWERYGDNPAKYAGMQFLGDHIYIAILASLSASKHGHPQLIAVHVMLLEVEIVVERLGAVAWSFYGLLQDRQAAVASFAGLLARGASITLAERSKLLSAELRSRGYSVERTLDNIAAAVSGTDIPEFRSVAVRLLAAQVFRLESGGGPSDEVKRLTSEALIVADRLDRERTFVEKISIKSFGSYEKTARSLIFILGLPEV